LYYLQKLFGVDDKLLGAVRESCLLGTWNECVTEVINDSV